MERASVEDLALSQLKSDAQVELLNAVDDLRKHGVQSQIDLPQLIVCGDQSSGKSSVLEAISHVRFPSNSICCTRFASELILRKAPTSKISVSIVPGPGRSARDKQHLLDFSMSSNVTGPQDFSRAIEEATQHINSLGDKTAFCMDKLRAEIQGEDQPHLTLVDLPGLIRTTNKDQHHNDIEIVEKLVRSYMENPKSIILAVVAATNNFSLQGILELAKEVDPAGERTLGIITKPDELYENTDGEREWVEVAQNRHERLGLGWHVLRNRDPTEENTSDASRDRVENELFRTAPWTTLDPETCGIDALRTRLSRVLLQSISRSLPSLLNDIKTRISVCSAKLDRLGAPRPSEPDQRLFLTTVSRELDYLVKAAVQGEYESVFFNNVKGNDVFTRRLRSAIRDMNERFAHSMYHSGHLYDVIEDSDGSERDKATVIDLSHEIDLATWKKPGRAIRSKYEDAITRYMAQRKGREMKGMYASSLIGVFFKKHSKPWEKFAGDHVESCLKVAQAFLRMAVAQVAPQHTCKILIREFVEPTFQRLTRALDAKLSELLKPYTHSDYPITLNPSLLAFVQGQQQKCKFRERISGSVGDVSLSGDGLSEAADILSRMQAYYQVRTHSTRYRRQSYLTLNRLHFLLSSIMSRRWPSRAVL